MEKHDWLEDLLQEELSRGIEPPADLDYSVKGKIRRHKEEKRSLIYVALIALGALLFLLLTVLGIWYFRNSWKVLLALSANGFLTGVGFFILYYFAEECKQEESYDNV